MDKRKIVVTLSVIVGCIIIGVLLYMFFSKDVTQEKILRDEIKTLSANNIEKNRYNSSIKTTKKYAKVEKAIKEYMDEYAINYQQVLKLVNDEKSLVLLSADNYKQDGPEFIKTKEYITDTKTKFNESFDKLSKMSSEKSIMESITKQNLGTYYENLYKELMFNKMITRQELNNIKTELDKDKKELINRLETEEAVINFLIENKDNWTVNNDKIVFKKTETLNQYNELVGKINK